jgi:hypothetical protein
VDARRRGGADGVVEPAELAPGFNGGGHRLAAIDPRISQLPGHDRIADERQRRAAVCQHGLCDNGLGILGTDQIRERHEQDQWHYPEHFFTGAFDE